MAQRRLDPRAASIVRDAFREALDRSIRHAVFLERHKSHIAAEVLDSAAPALEALEDAVLARVAKIGARDDFSIAGMARKQIEAIRQIVAERAKLTTKRMRARTDDQLLDLMEAEVSHASRLLEASLGADLGAVIASEASLPTRDLLRGIMRERPFDGRLLSEWWSGIERGTQDRVLSTVRAGLVRGDGVQAISRAVRQSIDLTRRQAESIVRTAATHVTTQAREETYRSMGVTERVVWVATLDARTCITCAELDGKRFALGDGPRPPIHVACRCTTAPVVPTLDEIVSKMKPAQKKAFRQKFPDGPTKELRASLGGPVDAKVTYEQWLRRQPRAVQNEVLGKGRAALFRARKISFDRFVDPNHKPLTLRELQELEKRLDKS